MKPFNKYRKKKDIKLTNQFYNELLDNRQSGAVKIARQLIQQDIPLPKVLKYLMKEGISYHEGLRIIRDVTHEKSL